MEYGIKFDRPSERYDEALMIGNGRLGAMVSGAVKERAIWLNEETVWYGGPRDRNNPDALGHMAKIRSLMRQGRTKEAERLATLTLTGVPESQRHYTTLGMVVIAFEGHDGEVSEYTHELDFRRAATCMSYRVNGVSCCMEAFASVPDQTIAIRLRADQPCLAFSAGIERGERVGQFSYGTHEDEILRDIKNCGVLMTGSCGGKTGLSFAGALYGSCDGEMEILGDKLVCRNATAAELYITAGTDYPEAGSLDPVPEAARKGIAARNKGFDSCMRDHLLEWQPLYNRVSAALDHVEDFCPPAMNRLFEAFEQDDFSAVGCETEEDRLQMEDYLVLLLFHFGRYILLSCGRACELPAALQGIWCRDLLSVWDGKYTVNINLQMAYWPVDSTNMSECFLPYLRLAERILENGRVTAEKMYGCRGFVLHNNTDIWADTAVQDAGTHCSYWFLGGVWIACDIFEHYRYTLDTEFLRRAWPILRDAARFILDFMEERDGKLVMGVTSSPENFYVDENGKTVSFCEMSAMDSQMIDLLFRDCCEAEEIIRRAYGKADMEADFIREVHDARSRLFQTQIGEDGTILEWGKEVAAEAEPMHRHLSHLLGAYPYHQISEETPELLRAVNASLDKRIQNGGCNTGWGRAWGAGLMARLKRADDARDMVSTMARYSGQPNLMSCCNIGKIPKLLENNKPMQIDGTMGTVQVVAEMLLQSYNNEILLLPALPSSWQAGSFTGLKARGNVTVHASWNEGRLQEAEVAAGSDGEVVIRSRDPFCAKIGDTAYQAPEGILTVTMAAGTCCKICAVKSREESYG